MPKRKTFTPGDPVDVRLGKDWDRAEYHHEVDMPPLWLGPGLHTVRAASGYLKTVTAAKIRKALVP